MNVKFARLEFQQLRNDRRLDDENGNRERSHIY